MNERLGTNNLSYGESCPLSNSWLSDSVLESESTGLDSVSLLETCLACSVLGESVSTGTHVSNMYTLFSRWRSTLTYVASSLCMKTEGMVMSGASPLMENGGGCAELSL